MTCLSRRSPLPLLSGLLCLLAIPGSAGAVGAPTYLSPDSVTLPKATASVTLQWSPVPGAAIYRVEAFEPSTAADPRDNCGAGAFGFLCVNQTATSLSLPVVAGRTYWWWVTAYDGAGGSAAASSVWFAIAANVADTTPPTVSIAWPTAGNTVEGTVPINLVASDDTGITWLQWYVDGALIQESVASSGTVLSPPYTALWDTRAYAKGSHTLSAWAYDAAGNAGSAAAVVTVNNDTPPCLSPSPTGADNVAINAALSGANAAAVLCPDKTYYLTAPITFSAAGQKLYTQGFPSGVHRARLVVSGASQVTAVQGGDWSGVSLRNVELDGNRGSAPHVEGGWALVELGGNASDIFVDSIKSYDPRGWSALHVFEGYVPSASSCRRAVVTHNELGPAGHPGGGNWADGLSFSCRDGFVAWNTVTDATDGAIVVFGAPGSRVLSNSIRALTRKVFGGINMVDWDPYSGDYRGTQVLQNTIDASGAPILAGIAMGRNVWGCVTDGKRNIGAVVRSNVVQGGYMGYGYPVNGVSDWTVTGNTSSATHSGTPVGCPGRPSALPAAFQKDYYQSGYTFQPEYVNGSVEYSPGLNVSGPVDKALSESAPVSGLSGASGSVTYYTFYVPSGTASVTFQTTGGSGDADLYVSRAEAPTTGQFLCRPYTSTSNETCRFTSPVPGPYYVMIRGYQAFSNVTLSVSTSRWFLSGQVLSGLIGAAASQLTYTLDVPAGVHAVTVNLSDGSGDADLYAKVGAPPSLSTFDCRPYVSGNTEQCSLNVQGPTTVYLMLNGYTDYAGASLRATLQ